jgi:nucleotide-binding universal stress UspA family protein
VADRTEPGDAVLARATAYLSGRGVHVEAQSLTGDVAPAVTSFVSTYAGDLLIAGAHGGRHRPWHIGSHAEQLLKTTSIPVIIHR